MSSTVLNGFPTLSRLLGKKNKDSSVSKSTSNLSSTLDTSSQHNKIIPLAASTNAPFEQTYRITIGLPRDQLFVVRVGAKTKLCQLLDTVCTSKQLDANKYEFRHPDDTRTYNNDMTIGEVGLNEIRLADKTDIHTYIKFNTDDIMKLRHLSRESLTSSSEFSKSSAKQSSYSKTISPYSSTNSLNSMDSATGMNPNHHHHNNNNNNSNHNNHNNNQNQHRHGSNSARSLHHPPVAPQRKKRIAPRPPSQNSISENQVVDNFKKLLPLAMPRKNFHASTPNLNGTTAAEAKFSLVNNNQNNNNNNVEYPDHEATAAVSMRNGSSVTDLNRRLPPVRPTTHHYIPNNMSNNQPAAAADRKQSFSGSTPQLNQQARDGPEVIPSEQLPTPKKRTFVAAAPATRKKAPPAPPPRLVIPVAPASTEIRSPKIEEVSSTSNASATIVATNNQTTTAPTPNPNISKVMLNVDSSEPIPTRKTEESLQKSSAKVIEIDSRDLPSIVSNGSTTSTNNAMGPTKSNDSSDEEGTNVYNIKTGKPMIVVQAAETNASAQTAAKKSHHSTIVVEVLSDCSITSDQLKDSRSSPVNVRVDSPQSPAVVNKTLSGVREYSEPESRAESPLWTYTLPAPPKFADTTESEAATTTTIDHPTFFNGSLGSSDTATVVSDLSDISDVPIKPIIKERMPLDFHIFKDTTTAASSATDQESFAASDVGNGYQSYSQKFSRDALLESLDRRREKFIENEFEFLTNEDEEDCGKSEQQHVVLEVGEVRKSTQVSRQTSVESEISTQSNVIDELKHVITNNKLDEIIKSVDRDEADLAGSDSTILSNFTIQTYNSLNGGDAKKKTSVIRTDDAKPNEFTSINPKLVSNESAPNVVSKSSPSSQHFISPKRSSLTNGSSSTAQFKTPTRSVNRSDSFHSTRPNFAAAVEPVNGLTPRSSSYISLIGSQKFENRSTATRSQFADTLGRRNSSSELSIADSPPLQSLSVMKSILSNSRKNSLNSDATLDVNPIALKLNRNTSVTDINAPAVDATEPTTHHASEASDPNGKANNNVTITQLNAPAAATAQPEKKWRYQGPPSINMSTWGDRPRSTICIKTDTDYKSSDGPASIVTTTSAAAPTAIIPPQPEGTTHRPVIVSSGQSKLPIHEQNNKSIPNDRVPIIRGVVPKTSTTLINNNNEAIPHTTSLQNRRPSYEVTTFTPDKPISTDSSGTMASLTLGRISIPNRWSQAQHFPAGVTVNGSSTGGNNNVAINTAAAAAVTAKTFKISDPVNATNPTNYAIAKDGSFDSGYKSMPPVYSELAAAKRAQAGDEPVVNAPFSQFTLRKTGLKDKILADPTTRNISSSNNAHPSIQTTTTTVQLRSRNGADSNNTGASATRRTFSVPAFVTPVAVAARPVSVVINNSQQSQPPPPPPPQAPPIVRAVQTKKTLPPPEADPRDQLLDAIRSFSRNGLKAQGNNNTS